VSRNFFELVDRWLSPRRRAGWRVSLTADTTSDEIPEPSVMPVDRAAWARQLDLTNFVNSYYQYRDLQLCRNAKTILIVGPGQGLDRQLLGWRGYEITTFDIDPTFKPDWIGSVHDLSMFSENQFDVVIASHVLEHIAVPYLDRSLAEIARVGRYALIYLPVAGRHLQLRLHLAVKGLDLSLIADLFNYFHRPDGVTPRYCAGQHYWELGRRGYRKAEVLKRLRRYFDVLAHYRNRDWNPSYNFVLRSKSPL
jgi:hypothetical protein